MKQNSDYRYSDIASSALELFKKVLAIQMHSIQLCYHGLKNNIILNIK